VFRTCRAYVLRNLYAIVDPVAALHPLKDPRTPDIIVTPDIGVVYIGGTKKVSEHGGFAHDDTNVLLLVSGPSLRRGTFNDWVETQQIAPTILKALGLDPTQLKAVQQEGTEWLPGLPF
jgi:hypothetical protein